MKKFVLALCLILLFVSAGFSQNRSSGAFTTSQVVVARPALLSDLGVQTDGTAAVTVLLYDNATTNSGTVLAFAYVPIGSTLGAWNCPKPLAAAAGIYAAVTGTGITRILVSYEP